MKKLSVVLLFVLIFCCQTAFPKNYQYYPGIKNGNYICVKADKVCNIKVYEGNLRIKGEADNCEIVNPPDYNTFPNHKKRIEYIRELLNSSSCVLISANFKKYSCKYPDIPKIEIWTENGKVISAKGRTYNKFKSLQEIYNPIYCHLIYEEKPAKPNLAIE